MHQAKHGRTRDEAASGRHRGLRWASQRSDRPTWSRCRKHALGRLVGKHRQTVEHLVVERLTHRRSVEANADYLSRLGKRID